MFTSKERLALINKGEKADRIPFMPTVFEHAAALINKTPSEVAIDEYLIEKSQIKAYEMYENDAVTVGVDVYNIEAEALGCTIKYHDDDSVPGIKGHVFKENIDIKNIVFKIDKGRIKKILNAADSINKKIGNKVNVGIGICGPFSICIELVGYENLIMRIINEEEIVLDLLEATLKFQKKYCDEIIKRGLGISIFESWATPPLISPNVYRKYVMPYEKRLIKYIKNKGNLAVPLIIGGNTEIIIDDIINTGTTLLLADYDVDIKLYAKKAEDNNILLRGNIDPKLVGKGSIDEIIKSVKELIRKKGDYKKFILGSGVVSYDTNPKNILAIKEYLMIKGKEK